MKSLSPEFQAHLDGGTTTLCHCWKLTRNDDTAFGFTDHDADIMFGGVVFEAVAGMSASAIESSSGLAVDNLDVVGALSSDRLSEADLAAGLFDDADVEIWRVNWADPQQRVLMRKGNLGEVSRGRSAFRAEIRGLAHKLNQPTGRIYQFTCDAVLGDARCGVDLSGSSFRGTGTVAAVIDGRTVDVTGLDAFTSDWFARGLLIFSSGSNTDIPLEVRGHIRSATNATIELWQSPPQSMNVGDAFVVTAGCDKTFTTCRARFANGVNFRGSPLMPGNDFVTSYPRRGDGHTGGSLQ
ncbi:DUF2163 domain-containing protein [Pyruvatibacter sp.]|uniref:DUF2163 domain-containing protein n=1 Tax=Pyruvatibacter sp. TaxID=1981328 RepID=UPI0032EFA83A